MLKKIFKFQYRIRTLFVLMTVAAVVTYVGSNRRLWWPTQQEAAREIGRLGGLTEGSDKVVLAGFHTPNFTNKEFRWLEPLVDVRVLAISDSMATGIAFRHCTQLENIAYIQFNNCAFTGDCFKYLENNKQLNRVYIEDTPISNAGLNQILKFNKLESITIEHLETPSQITEIDPALIAKLPLLRQLFITMDEVPEGLEEELRAILPNCSIHLDDGPDL